MIEESLYWKATYLQVIHPVLTFGLPIRVRLTGDIDESLLAEVDGDGDLLWDCGGLGKGMIGSFAPGEVMNGVI